ncbi:AMP-dependent synthetase, partial [Sulfolobus sp. B5]
MDYVTLYNYALQKPDKYWESYANRLYFEKKWERAIQRNEKLPIAKWFVNGLTNISYNSLSHSGKAIIFYHENGKRRDLTFNELNDLSSRIAGLLLDKGLKKGDRIAIYMPNMIETIATILASARLGVIYSL